MVQQDRKFTDIIELDYGWEIESDTGFEPITKVCQTIEYDIWHLRTNSCELRCADDHRVFDEYMQSVFVKNLQIGQVIQTKNGLEPVLLVYNTGMKEQMYDIEVDSPKHCYYSNSIASHNTTITVCWLLHFLLTNQNKAVCILANKLDQAQEILERIQTAYTNLPKWLQVGVEEWNKRSMKLENGCTVLAAATSSDSVRGRSYALVFIDECAFVSKNLWSKFWTSTWPTISSGKKSRFIIVSTPNGKNHFYDFWKGAIDGTNDYHPMEVNWWDVPGRDEQWKKNQLKTMSEEQFNVEYGNSFLASAATLLNPDTLIKIRDDIKEPIQFNSNSKIYELPEPEKKYVATVDCADDGGDFSTISVIDISAYPFRQVAVYSDNSISALSFPMVIEQFAKKYNEAFVLVESNNIGSTVTYILNYDIEYENIIRTVNNQGKLKIGQLTTSKTKKIGCSRLKDMLDTGKLIIQDAGTYSELGHFCKKGSSYEAETGYHDDMVMGLVNFAYYASTNDFRNFIDHNFADEYRAEMEDALEESLSPLPLFGADVLRGNSLGSDDIAWLNS